MILGSWAWLLHRHMDPWRNRPEKIRARGQRAQRRIALKLHAHGFGTLVQNDLDESRLELDDSRREARLTIVLTPETIRLETPVMVPELNPAGAIVDRSLARGVEFAQSGAPEFDQRLVAMGPDPAAQLRRLSQRLRQLISSHALPNLVHTRDRVQVSAGLSNEGDAEAWIRANIGPLLALATALRQHERDFTKGAR